MQGANHKVDEPVAKTNLVRAVVDLLRHVVAENAEQGGGNSIAAESHSDASSAAPATAASGPAPSFDEIVELISTGQADSIPGIRSIPLKVIVPVAEDRGYADADKPSVRSLDQRSFAQPSHDAETSQAMGEQIKQLHLRNHARTSICRSTTKDFRSFLQIPVPTLFCLPLDAFYNRALQKEASKRVGVRVGIYAGITAHLTCSGEETRQRGETYAESLVDMKLIRSRTRFE